MDSSKKYQIDEWVKSVLYGFFEQLQKRGAYPTPAEIAQITPFLQMYQAHQLEGIMNELSSLGSLFYGGEASVSVHPDFSGFDVNVKKMPEEGKEK